MSQVQETSELTEQKVLDDLSQAAGSKVSMGDLSKMSRIQYEVAFMQLMQNLGNMTTREICRSVSNAIDLPVGSGLAKKFVKEHEARTAALLAQVIDLRNILQADKMQKEFDEQQKVVVATEPKETENESV